MTGFDHRVFIAALNDAPTQDTQIAALRAIKNNITGHKLRKAEYIRSGIIPSVSRILPSNPSPPSQTAFEPLEDQLWIYAANIIGSLAYGGPSYVQPILQNKIVANLATQLAVVPKPRVSLAILKCLNVIADNLPLSSPDDWTPDRRLAASLYTTPGILTSLTRFVEEAASSSLILQQICDATLALVCKTCDENGQKQSLVRAGMLAALANRLASFVVAEGLVIPDSYVHDVEVQERDLIPEPLPGSAHLSPVLETLGILTDTSRPYAAELLYNPSVRAVLPSSTDRFAPADLRTSPFGATYFSGGAVPRTRARTPLDLLLPQILHYDGFIASDVFPPLGSDTQSQKRRSPSIRPVTENSSTPFAEDYTGDPEDCLLVSWLLYMIRLYRGKRRILASRILVNLSKHGLVAPSRNRYLKSLVVPLLVQALDQNDPGQDEDLLLSAKRPYRQMIPSVLARLILDDEKLQKVAVESRAITKLAMCLKATFDPLNEKSALWRPWKHTSTVQGEMIDCHLGPGGPSLAERHTMFYREGLLQALAAIAPFNDHYRKEICDQGVLAQIMLALEPFRCEAKISQGEDPTISSTGNSASTLLAACDAVRALTRSVTALRTKLVDSDIGKAIVKLLNCPDPEVTIAATKVIANLAIDFSPMKSTISEPMLVKKLCEQAHSANARLRLESIWALKHLVLRSANNLKRDVIDELGASWIRHLIATNPYDIPPGEVIGLVEKEYPPRPAHHAGAGDVIMSEGSDDDGVLTLNAIRDHSDYNKHTIEDDLAIQEQLLDLLRNLFCGENSAEIVEYVLQEIGYQEFIRIILDRLKSKIMIGATRKANQVSSAPSGIVNATLHIVVHLAACQPKFRNMITANTSLMKQILMFHQNADRKIRVAVCWISINLTYGDNPAEREACKARALQLNKVGFLSHMRRMEGDFELDVRERAKTAVLLLEKLIPKEMQR